MSKDLRQEDLDQSGILHGKGFRVKWKGRSYIHCSFVPQSSMLLAQKRFPSGIGVKLRRFLIEEEEVEWRVMRPHGLHIHKLCYKGTVSLPTCVQS